MVKPLFSERYDPEKREQYDALQEESLTSCFRHSLIGPSSTTGALRPVCLTAR